MSQSFIITSGYFNPIHPGHIECFQLSRQFGDKLIVIINNDHQAQLKRGVKSFQDEQYRATIVKNLQQVDEVVISIDQSPSVAETLEKIITDLRKEHPDCKITFTKGGDRFGSEIPEAVICTKHNVEIQDGLGAKTHSSSDYAAKAQ